MGLFKVNNLEFTFVLRHGKIKLVAVLGGGAILFK